MRYSNKPNPCLHLSLTPTKSSLEKEKEKKIARVNSQFTANYRIFYPPSDFQTSFFFLFVRIKIWICKYLFRSNSNIARFLENLNYSHKNKHGASIERPDVCISCDSFPKSNAFLMVDEGTFDLNFRKQNGVTSKIYWTGRIAIF